MYKTSVKAHFKTLTNLDYSPVKIHTIGWFTKYQVLRKLGHF